jgi:hypothetical protein
MLTADGGHVESIESMFGAQSTQVLRLRSVAVIDEQFERVQMMQSRAHIGQTRAHRSFADVRDD